MSRSKQRSFASDLRFSKWWQLFTMPGPPSGKVSISLLSLIAGFMAGLVLLLYMGLGLGSNPPFIELGDISIPVREVLLVIFFIFAVFFVVSFVFTGENARGVLHWTGFYGLSLRKVGVRADDRPISRTITRVMFYSLLAVQLAFFLWWWIFTSQSLLGAEQIADPIQLEEALQAYAVYRLGIYAPILPVLVVLCGLAVLGLEQVPGPRFFFRRTKLLIFPVVPLIAFFQLRTFILWVMEVFKSTLPTLTDLF